MTPVLDRFCGELLPPIEILFIAQNLGKHRIKVTEGVLNGETVLVNKKHVVMHKGKAYSSQFHVVAIE